MEQQYDVVVIGGGAAGLSGALALSRARRSVLVVDSGRPRNAPAAAATGIACVRQTFRRGAVLPRHMPGRKFHGWHASFRFLL